MVFNYAIVVSARPLASLRRCHTDGGWTRRIVLWAGTRHDDGNHIINVVYTMGCGTSTLGRWASYNLQVANLCFVSQAAGGLLAAGCARQVGGWVPPVKIPTPGTQVDKQVTHSPSQVTNRWAPRHGSSKKANVLLITRTQRSLYVLYTRFIQTKKREEKRRVCKLKSPPPTPSARLRSSSQS